MHPRYQFRRDAHGRPPRSTVEAIKGPDQLIVKTTGLLVPPEDPAALAGALQTLLQDGILRERMGNRGRLRAMEAHDIVRIASELAGAFAAGRRQQVRSARQYA